MKKLNVSTIKDFLDYQNFIIENPHVDIVNVIHVNGQMCVTYREEDTIEYLREYRESVDEHYKYIEEHNREKMIHRREFDSEDSFQYWLCQNSDSHIRWQHIYREEDKIVVIYV